jgi:hypothetical protein
MDDRRPQPLDEALGGAGRLDGDPVRTGAWVEVWREPMVRDPVDALLAGRARHPHA